MEARQLARCRYLAAPLLLLSQAGCMFIPWPEVPRLPDVSEVIPWGPDLPSIGTCEVRLVEVNANRDVPTDMVVSVTEASRLMDIARASGATREFRNMEGVVSRRDENGDFIELEAEWDRRWGAYTPETNFAILPGDRVRIEQIPSKNVQFLRAL